MNARALGSFVVIAFVVLILLIGCHSIVLHLHVLHPRTSLDYYLAGVAERVSPWVYVGDLIIADVTIFLRSPLLIFFWMAATALFWGLFMTRGDPR